ncbi:YraN family protein [bacterium SCSIO 12741]|nr:YraN family protein [bacterium SCSIO 12741]
MAEHLHLGQKGETAALQYLIEQGYSIRAQNWKHGHLEVDLIANISDELVFVEVKTRSTDYFGHPAEAVTDSKKEHLYQAAEAYLEDEDEDWECRFDVIAVIINSKGVEIDHMPDAFGPEF